HARQSHLVPAAPEEELALARRLGFRGVDAVAIFRDAHAAHTGAVHAAFEALFHGAEEARRRDERPDLATLVDELTQEEPTRARLEALGFRDPAAALEDLRLLRSEE